MNMSFVISEQNKNMIDQLCKVTRLSKSHCINEALAAYLEDQLDILEATKVLANTKKEDITEFDANEYGV